jgi:hypothetical protein
MVRQLNALLGAVIYDSFFGPATAIRSLPRRAMHESLGLSIRVAWSLRASVQCTIGTLPCPSVMHSEAAFCRYEELKMATLMRATVLMAVTAAAALLVTQPVQAATAAVQPHRIVTDVGDSAKLVVDVGRRGGGYWRGRGGHWRGGWGHRGWGHRGWGHRGWGHRGWGWRGRGWGHRRWGWGGPRFYGGYGYGYPCGYGYPWGYGYGCPYYGYYGRPVITFGFGW